MHSGPPDFLIVGTPRSGTTLVQRLASELDGVKVPPETHFFRLFAPGLMRRRRFPLSGEALVDELRAFASLEELQGLDLDPCATADRLGGRVDTVVALFGGIVQALAGDAAVYGEKTPSHLRWWRELNSANPRLKLVAVVRDPRAVVASYFEAWGERPHSVIAERWAIDYRSLGEARAALGDRCLVLRYEDVVDDPSATRDELAVFLDRPIAGAQVSKASIHLPWEKWKERSTCPITRDRVEGWRDVLSAQAVREIETIAGREMRLCGYAVEGPSVRLAARDQIRRHRYRLARQAERFRRKRLARRGGFA